METPPPRRTATGNKWVFKVNAKPDGSVDRFKARLAAQGFRHRVGVDYSETFSPIVRLNTLRIVMAISAKRNMHIHSANIETAVFNADLQEEIDMHQSRGVEDGTPRVMRLLKSIYGMKQASREWSKLFHHILSSLALKRAIPYTNLYTMNHPMHGICIVMVYVDDILTVLDTLKWIESAKRAIGEQFRVTDFGEAKLILGMDIVINREARTISLS
jgi:hypothetical protein